MASEESSTPRMVYSNRLYKANLETSSGRTGEAPTKVRKAVGPTKGRALEEPTGGRRLEYPIRGVHTHKKKKWEIFDLGTGELLETLRVGKDRFILVVLDGDHVITDD